MKKQILLKLLYCSLVILVLAGFNQCIAPGGKSIKSELTFKVRNTNTTGGGFASEEARQVSILAFKETVHQITLNNCASCHGNTQSPLHAVEDPETAHNALLNTFKIDFNNIPNSRMVKKLRNEFHNCWDDCELSAAEMQAAIVEWKRIIDDSAINNSPVTPPPATPPVTPPPVTPPVTPPPVTPPVTPPPVMLSSAEGYRQTLWPVLRNNCMGCHGTSQAPLHAHADFNVAHTNVINRSLVNFTTVTSSKILSKLRAKHNCGSNCTAWATEAESQIINWKNLSGK